MASRQEHDVEKGIINEGNKQEAAPTRSSSSGGGDVEFVRKRLEKKLLEKEAGMQASDHGGEPSIFRVPRNLKDVGGKAYLPQMVSIGPFHHGNRQVAPMEKHKLRYLRQFLRRTDLKLGRCVEIVTEIEPEARRCYAGHQDLQAINSGKFAEMMLLDACFILELFHQFGLRGQKKNGDADLAAADAAADADAVTDPLFSAHALMPCIQRDMLMLENQIPLFVLEHLFSEASRGQTANTVTSLALDFFEPAIHGPEKTPEDDETQSVHIQEGTAKKNKKKKKKVQPLHLLHIIQQSLVPPHDKVDEGEAAATGQTKRRSIIKGHQPHLMAHSVSDLRDYGVGFKRNKLPRMTEIGFRKGRLEIPQLVINDSTRSILLNLMAFEQCYSQCGNDVTSYVNFMDGIINGPRDVSHLCHKEILVHRLGSEVAVARLFNHLCREMAFEVDEGYLSRVSKEVDMYVKKKRHRWWASLKHEYLRHPWAIISIFTAILLLALTVMGTLYALLSFYLHRS